MDEINSYILNIPKQQKERISQVVNYIRKAYPDCIESMDYTPNLKFPLFIENGNYIGVASRDNYLTLHFGKAYPDKAEPHAALGYVNIQDEIPLPMQEIENTVNFCFGLH